jgi:8-oxo-dGTP pyrophosphatase MutT (NUDIX family)
MTFQQATIESIAKLLIIDNQNRGLVLTLGKHLKYPEKSFLPDLPGGIVDPGESEQSAAIREASEECGIELDAKKVQLAYTETKYYEKENKSISKLLYIAHVDSTPEITLSWEHSDYKWVPVSELHTMELRPFFKKAIEYSIAKGLL